MPVWFITGTSSGFGLLLALKALSAGHVVVGTMRNLERSAAAVESITRAGGHVVQMDMTESRGSILTKIQDAEKRFGPIDYLVNNAGYSVLGPIESFTESEAETQIKTNVLGPLYAIQAVQPSMRSRRAGTIVNVSSVAGQDGLPTCGLYAASKFCLEGLSEVLAKEMAEFDVTVLIVEPGAFRTNFLAAKRVSGEADVEAAYKGSLVGKVMGMFDEADGRQPGDPEKAVDVVFGVATGEGRGGALRGQVLRLPLGRDAFERIQTKVDGLQRDLDACREIGTATDLDE